MKKLILGFAFLLVAIPCEARVITVDDDGPADFKIIQAAIGSANDGDTVLIYPGTYYENLRVNGKSITLTSIDPADANVVAATVIDGNSLGTVVSVIDVNGADANAVITGLTITNGLAKTGGGIYCEDSNIVISKCVITGNTTNDGEDNWEGDGGNGGDGGGIYCTSSSSVTVSNCVISGNATGKGGESEQGRGGNGGDGGGIYGSSSSITIANTRIIGNKTGYPPEYSWCGNGGSGGGIYYESSSLLTIKNCIISNNTASSAVNYGYATRGGSGGGIYSIAPVSATGCTINNNTDGDTELDGGNGGSGGGIYCEASVSITDCNLNGNRTGRGGGSMGWEWLGGNGGDGGAIYCSSAVVNDCTIRCNSTGDGGEGWWDGRGGAGGDGGGIYCTSAIITDCTIDRNATGNGGNGEYGGYSPGGNGGGIYCALGVAKVKNCEIMGNTTGSGGWSNCFGSNGGSGAGIYCTESVSPIIEHCRITGNVTGSGADAAAIYHDDAGGNGGSGAGIFCYAGAIRNCSITNNLTGRGGDGGGYGEGPSSDGGNGGSGAGVFGLSAMITNCTVANNITGVGGIGGSGGGVDGQRGSGAGIYANNSTMVNNAIICGNSPDEVAGHDCNNVSYCDICDGFCKGANANISIDPLFADPNNGDYHLKSQAGRWDPNSQSWVTDANTSPCIDAGDPHSDWTAELWPNGKRINMGAYGGTPEASMSLSNIGNVADLNHDEKVDFEDFALLAECWAVKHILLAEDLDLDGEVDTNDIYVFAENWLWDKQGLVGCWKFDDGNGTVAYDSSGYNNTGVFVSEPVWTLGKFDGGLRFDGIDDAVEIKTDRLDPNAGSISLWAYAEAFSTMPHYLFGHTASHPWNNRIQLYVSDPNGNLALGLGDVHFRHMGIEKLNLNRWYHFVLTWNGKTYEVYVDGVLKATGSYTGLSRLSTFADIGNDGNPVYRDESFCGIIDEVRIYSRTLTPIEVLYLFNE